MGRISTIVGTAFVTAVLTSVFWFLAFNTRAQVEATPTVAPAPRSAPVANDVAIGPRGLAIPVSGVRITDLVDTYKQARAGGARVHDAIDIMAASGTPVLAAAPGRLEKLFISKGGGGITAYVRSMDGRWSYYYAHLQDYAPGLTEGMPIQRGQMLGRVGFTGNANPAGPHLHFAINQMNERDGFWQGRPVNPYPLLAGK